MKKLTVWILALCALMCTVAAVEAGETLVVNDDLLAFLGESGKVTRVQMKNADKVRVQMNGYDAQN